MLKIITSPDPLLNQVCEPCDLSDKGLKKLAIFRLQKLFCLSEKGRYN